MAAAHSARHGCHFEADGGRQSKLRLHVADHRVQPSKIVFHQHATIARNHTTHAHAHVARARSGTTIAIALGTARRRHRSEAVSLNFTHGLPTGARPPNWSRKERKRTEAWYEQNHP